MDEPEPTAPDGPDVPDRFSVDFTGLTRLGIYRVEEKPADGGMGSIYVGEDTNLGRRVVIKVPHVKFLGEPGFRARFRRAITDLVRLEHPSIVRILAQGEHEDVPFSVLQFLGGGSLEDVFEARDGAGPFQGDTAIELLIAKKTEDPVALSTIAPQVPARVSDAVMRSLARDPADRFPSCAAFVEAAHDYEMVMHMKLDLELEGEDGAPQTREVGQEVTLTLQMGRKERGTRVQAPRTG